MVVGLSFALEDEAGFEFDLDADLAVFGALDEGDEDAAGDVFADFDGDFAGIFIGRDREAVDADAFPDGVKDVGGGRAREGDDGVGKLDRLAGGEFRDIFVEEDAGEDRAGGK